MSTFHLALPTHDINLSKEFYTKAFGATLGREYPHYVIFNFFGHQLVTHLTHNHNEISKEVKMYPRHHGIIFDSREDFDSVYHLCKNAEAPFYEDIFERHQNKPGWHFSYFVSDPSNNLIELKYYVNQSDVFN